MRTYLTCITILLNCFFVELAATPVSTNTTVLKIDQTCSIVLEYPQDMQDSVGETEKYSLLYITLNSTRSFFTFARNSVLYEPFRWIETSGQYGYTLLQLNPNYEMLSLNSLSFHTDNKKVQIYDRPKGCLGLHNTSQYEKTVRTFLLTNSNGKYDRICNMHVRNSFGYADFHYVCCSKKSRTNETFCERLQKNYWLKVIYKFTFLVIVLIFLYWPMLIPSSLYRSKYFDSPFYLKTPHVLSDRVLNDTHLQKLHELGLKVRFNQVISENDVPICLWKMVYDKFIRCKFDENTKCCHKYCLKSFGLFVPWYKFLRLLMRIILLSTPWVMRVVFYYAYENDIRSARQKAADERNLKMPYSTSLTYFLTPVHVLFIICYVIILSCFSILRIGARFGSFLKKTLRDCEKKTTDDSRKVFDMNWSFDILSMPLSQYGILGIFAIPFYWIFAVPFVFIILIFHIFPSFVLIVSLVQRILSSSKPDEKIKKVCSIIVLFPLVVSFAILSFECIMFLIQALIYTLIGVILNYSHAMQYISTFTIIIIYFINCFGGLGKTYSNFNKVIQSILIDEVKEDFEDVANLSSDIQKNTAFTLKKYDEISTFNNSIQEENEMVQTEGVILLLDRYDNHYITRGFFLKACKIEHPYCPGNISRRIANAFKRFMVIIVFLCFVTFVVLAFGDTYGVSISNQLLVSVTGGFVPWVLMKAKILFSDEEEDFSQLGQNRNFMNKLRELITCDEENWNSFNHNISSGGC